MLAPDPAKTKAVMPKSRTLQKSTTIEPGTAAIGEVAKGQRLRVVDVAGGQIGDFIALNKDDPAEHLDCTYTNWLNNGWRWKEATTIFTNHMNRMWLITEDPTGVHFTGGGFCSNDARRLLVDPTDATKGCRDCLEDALAERNIEKHFLHAASCFNLFMNIEYRPDGSWEAKPPVTGAGDYIELRAEMDMLWALSVCVIPSIINRPDPTPLRVDILQ